MCTCMCTCLDFNALIITKILQTRNWKLENFFKQTQNHMSNTRQEKIQNYEEVEVEGEEVETTNLHTQQRVDDASAPSPPPNGTSERANPQPSTTSLSIRASLSFGFLSFLLLSGHSSHN